MHGTWAALERMRPRDRGMITNVGSAMAYRSIPPQSPYCGVKHAVKGFTESVMTGLAHEKSKVKLCMVQLRGLNTPQFNWNLNKMGKSTGTSTRWASIRCRCHRCHRSSTRDDRPVRPCPWKGGDEELLLAAESASDTPVMLFRLPRARQPSK